MLSRETSGMISPVNTTILQNGANFGSCISVGIILGQVIIQKIVSGANVFYQEGKPSMILSKTIFAWGSWQRPMLNGEDYQPENDREDQQEDNIGDQQKETQRPSADDEDQVATIPWFGGGPGMRPISSAVTLEGRSRA
ncbi:hypothetical protein F443_11009 [Phytophthora nicotianae P1569]|uniref:Uncharacterized protein n=1 Tax=Phytophthora nicotianae P1569 TaxID=1317065 RepID=V9EYA4_PHYNI|nr:hypothetical protein F443_11009 [Phytophthora nicotianae P1569]